MKIISDDLLGKTVVNDNGREGKIVGAGFDSYGNVFFLVSVIKHRSQDEEQIRFEKFSATACTMQTY